MYMSGHPQMHTWMKCVENTWKLEKRKLSRCLGALEDGVCMTVFVCVCVYIVYFDVTAFELLNCVNQCSE